MFKAKLDRFDITDLIGKLNINPAFKKMMRDKYDISSPSLHSEGGTLFVTGLPIINHMSPNCRSYLNPLGAESMATCSNIPQFTVGYELNIPGDFEDPNHEQRIHLANKFNLNPVTIEVKNGRVYGESGNGMHWYKVTASNLYTAFVKKVSIGGPANVLLKCCESFKDIDVDSALFEVFDNVLYVRAKKKPEEITLTAEHMCKIIQLMGIGYTITSAVRNVLALNDSVRLNVNFVDDFLKVTKL